jgi:diaminopimelate epimerase
MEMTFTKMHGTGNDFIVIDCRKNELADPKDFAVRYCNRRLGVGADQVLLLCSSEQADFRMLIYNADGSEVEMCGNGIRCLARYIWDRGLSDKDVLEVETLAGIIRPERTGETVRVDMGEPVFDKKNIPVAVSGDMPLLDYPLNVMGRDFGVTCISMGNPHAVIFPEEDVSLVPLEKYGAAIETHPLFPRRTNVEFINVNSREELTMRVWERGAGETLACGTGACAAAVAAMIKGLTERRVIVHLGGGDLEIQWAADNHVYMTGPAVEVFEGKIRMDSDDGTSHPGRT